MGKSCESMQPSESSTDVACRRARGGHKETELGGGNQTIASAKSENCECGGQERASTGHKQERASTLTQDTVNDNRPVPMLAREPESRGTQHIRLLIPRGIKGLSENDLATLQAWLELGDWTEKNVSPHTNPKKA